jgi:hypothetical protein
VKQYLGGGDMASVDSVFELPLLGDAHDGILAPVPLLVWSGRHLRAALVGADLAHFRI